MTNFVTGANLFCVEHIFRNKWTEDVWRLTARTWQPTVAALRAVKTANFDQKPIRGELELWSPSLSLQGCNILDLGLGVALLRKQKLNIFLVNLIFYGPCPLLWYDDATGWDQEGGGKKWLSNTVIRLLEWGPVIIFLAWHPK